MELIILEKKVKKNIILQANQTPKEDKTQKKAHLKFKFVKLIIFKLSARDDYFL